MWHDVRLLNGVTSVLLSIFVAAVLTGCFLWIAQKPFFSLKVIQVKEMEGRALKHVNALTVKGIALPRIKGNFFTVDLESVRDAFKSVPWIREVTVKRKWPNGLIVAVEEHKPLGTWGDGGRLLSVKGDVFTANLAEAEAEADLLKFYGPEGSEKEVAARCDDLKKGFAKIKLTPVSIKLSDRYAWHLVLNNGMKVHFGREDSGISVQEQMARLLAVYPRLAVVLKNGIQEIDLRYPNGLALKAEGLVPDIGIQ